MAEKPEAMSYIMDQISRRWTLKEIKLNTELKYIESITIDLRRSNKLGHKPGP